MPRTATLLILAVLAGLAIGAGATTVTVPEQDHGSAPNASLPEDAELGQFENAESFRAYLESGRSLRVVEYMSGGPGGAPDAVRGTPTAVNAEAASDSDAPRGAETQAPSRIGTTNIQVGGLDEPDRVKTDGRNFYVSPGNREHRHVKPDDGTRTEPPEPSIHVVDASEPPAPQEVAAVDGSGRLLVANHTLVQLDHDTLVGFDVSDPADPVQSWQIPLNGSLVTARERAGTIYLVTETRIGADPPCPIEPLGAEDGIACEDVYRPGVQIAADATYSVFAIDGQEGTVEDQVSVVGTARNTVVYMSQDDLYVTYTAETSRIDLLSTFLREEFEQTPDWLLDRIDELESYDISARSKEIEIRNSVEEWLSALPADRKESVRSSLQEQHASYVAEHRRNLTRTGIVRIDVEEQSISVDASGSIPGRPLNQFSMSEHEGVLRITTTIPAGGDADSANDLYTLNATTLEERGSVTDMGLNERVYSVRYVGDTAYVVTFRRIDPFHVLDLSDPEAPELQGELKLPGFSSYLHPVSEDRVLGIGEEDGQVKTVLFDVSEPTNPTIANDRVLAERWSAISETHHAFSIDRRHGVFFLPAGESGLVLEYENDSLTTKANVETDGRAIRARYVDDYLYVFDTGGMTVLDETTWEETTRLDYET